MFMVFLWRFTVVVSREFNFLYAAEKLNRFAVFFIFLFLFSMFYKFSVLVELYPGPVELSFSL